MAGVRLALVIVLALLVGCAEKAPPTDPGLVVEELTVDSLAVRDELPVKVVVPGDGPLPLLVFLHGRGNDGGWDRHWPDYLRFYARALERC